MAKVLYMCFTKLTLLKFGLELMLPKLLENKSQMILLLMFSGAEHKYMIQVHKHKVINVLPITLFISLWKVDGALHSPNGSTVYSNNPYRVIKAVFS